MPQQRSNRPLTVRYRKAGSIEILQAILEAFQTAPLLFLVPLLLLAFIVWSPWSPQNFYIHHDLAHLDTVEPTLQETETTQEPPESRRAS